MRVGGFRIVNYSFYGQNGVILTFLEPKRCRFSHHNFFKFLHIYMDYEGPKQRRFESVVAYPKWRRLGK